MHEITYFKISNFWFLLSQLFQLSIFRARYIKVPQHALVYLSANTPYRITVNMLITA